MHNTSGDKIVDCERSYQTPIIPEAGISCVNLPGCTGSSIGRLFPMAWKRIPLNDRETLLAFWQKPWLGRTVLITTQTRLGRRGYAIGETTFAGREVSFCEPLLNQMPDDVAAAAIAHELAHVRLFIDSHDHLSGDDDQEDAAWQLTREWGFDNDKLSAWIAWNKKKFGGWIRQAKRSTVILDEWLDD